MVGILAAEGEGMTQARQRATRAMEAYYDKIEALLVDAYEEAARGEGKALYLESMIRGVWERQYPGVAYRDAQDAIQQLEADLMNARRTLQELAGRPEHIKVPKSQTAPVLPEKIGITAYRNQAVKFIDQAYPGKGWDYLSRLAVGMVISDVGVKRVLVADEKEGDQA